MNFIESYFNAIHKKLANHFGIPIEEVHFYGVSYLMDRLTPVTPARMKFDTYRWTLLGDCPVCHAPSNQEHTYCSDCSRRLLWPKKKDWAQHGISTDEYIDSQYEEYAAQIKNKGFIEI